VASFKVGGKEKVVLYENLMEDIVSKENLALAYKKVCQNKGAPGIDGMSTKQLGKHLTRNWEVIKTKLKTGKYNPEAIKGVQIRKKDGGVRQLGIPTCQDRFIQQAIAQKVSDIIEPKMSKRSYGYRPNKSAHDAIMRAGYYVTQGKTWVVEIDIKAFFDHVDHDILMAQLAKETRDKMVLKLIGKYLRADLQQGNHRVKRNKGTPQGGPLSPLLANLYLDPLDKELEKRELCFCRYADDINIYVSSERSGQRILASLSKWIEKHLKLKLSEQKSKVTRPWKGNFLGFTILESGQAGIAKASFLSYKNRVRALWDARQSLTSKELVKQWRYYVIGWWNYFSIAAPYRDNWSGWTRRHIRKCFWQRWKSKKGRRRNLRKLGVKDNLLKRVDFFGSAWRSAKHPAMHRALNNKTLQRYGLVTPDVLAAT
jgi:group II intron reverse transcriptase/maturase